MGSGDGGGGNGYGEMNVDEDEDEYASGSADAIAEGSHLNGGNLRWIPTAGGGAPAQVLNDAAAASGGSNWMPSGGSECVYGLSDHQATRAAWLRMRVRAQ